MTLRLPENPVLAKELRTRMRGTRAYWILLAYVGLPSLVVLLTYGTFASQQSASGSQTAFQLGKVFYSTVFTIQALLVGVITPALTAGGISLEKEQRTYDLLSLTKLPRRAIIHGKLFSATLFVALLLTASLPLASLCFLLGGVAPSQVAAAYVILLSCAFLYGAAGIAASSVAKSTTNATTLAYGAILVHFFITLPLAVAGFARSFGAALPGLGLTALNPVGAVNGGNLSELYFGLSLPAWLPAILLNGLLGIILTVTAIHRLEYPRTDRTPLLRLLCAGFTLLMAYFVYGFIVPQTTPAAGGSPADRVMAVSVVTLCATAVLAAIFATGDAIKTPGSLLRLIFDPRRLPIGDAASGLLYSALLMLVCGAVLYVGAGSFSRGDILKLILLSLAFLWAVGTTGIWLSAKARDRWAALAASLAFSSVLLLIPMLTLVHAGNGPRKATAFDNLLYFSPFPAALEMSGENTTGVRSPKLIFRDTPFLGITSALYLGMGGLALAAAQRGKRKP